MTFDRTLGQSLNFVDGTSDFHANIANAMVLAHDDVQGASKHMAANKAAVVLGAPDVAPGASVVSHVTGLAVASLDLLKSDGERLFVLAGDLNCYVFDHETLEQTDVDGNALPVFAASWGAGDLTAVGSNGEYLFLQGNDSGAGVDKIDVIRLSDEVVIGTYSAPAGTIQSIVIGRQHVFFTHSDAKIRALLLTTAALDPAWGTSGESNMSAVGVGPIAIDDNNVYFGHGGDDIEAFNVVSGAQSWVSSNLGTGTTIREIWSDGRYLFLDYLDYIVVARRTDGLLVQEVAVTSAITGGDNQFDFDGVFVYRNLGGAVVEILDPWTGFPAARVASSAADTHLATDGMDLFCVTAISPITLTRFRGLHNARTFVKRAGSGYGRRFGRNMVAE